MRSPYLLPPALAVGIVASPAYEALHDITPSLVRAVLQHAVRGEEAQDPLTNGDFETGSLPPWNFTQLGKPLGVAASLVPTERRGPENATAAGGHWHLCLSTNWHRPLLGTTRATLEQPLFVQDGVKYNLSWRMMGRGGDKVAWSVGLRGAETVLASGETGGDGQWHNYTSLFVGSASDVLVITAATPEEYGIAEWHFDDFAVQAI